IRNPAAMRALPTHSSMLSQPCKRVAAGGFDGDMSVVAIGRSSLQTASRYDTWLAVLSIEPPDARALCEPSGSRSCGGSAAATGAGGRQYGPASTRGASMKLANV